MTTARLVLRLLTLALLAATCPLHPARADDRGISPEVLFESEIAGAPNKLMRALRTTYQPGAVNPKHYHTSYVVFYVLQGSGVWQEDGKAAVTLKPGDSLAVTPGTIHSHWNASTTEPLVFTEFVVVDKGQRSTVPMR